MKKLFVALSFTFCTLPLISGCFVQTDNSVANDQSAFATMTGGSAAFMQASKILKTNCVSCHGDFGTNSEADFVSQGLITPKLPYQSKLYKKLKGANAGANSGDMPQNAAPLSSSDLQTLRNWIESVSVAAPTSAFGKVQAVLGANCVTCHKDFAQADEKTFVSEGLVIPGNSDASRLYYKLLGTNITGRNPDMPLDNPALSTDDLQSVRLWIDQLPSANFPQPSPTPDTPFNRAKSVMLDSCVQCHKKYPSMSELDFVAQQLVTPGNAETSTLYKKLIGSGTAGADMPKKGAPLLSDQIQTIKTWIEQIPAVSPIPMPSPVPSSNPSPTPSSSPSPGTSPQPTPTASTSPLPTASPLPSASPFPSASPAPSGSPSLPNASARTAAALAVIQNHCADCHGDPQVGVSTEFAGKQVAAFGNFTTDAEFLSSSLVTPTDPDQSWLIRSLKGVGDIHTMPKDDSGIPAQDLQTLRTWISELGQP